jgi:phage shock protein A
MIKRLQNLERLCQKMQTRYGEHDTMVMQLMTELATLKLQIRQSEKAAPNFLHSRTVRPKAHLELH